MHRNTRPRSAHGVTWALALLLLPLTGCDDSITFPDTDPSILGDVVGIGSDVPFGSPTSIWVKEQPDSPCGVVFRIDGDTEIGERQPDGSIAERDFADIGLGYTLRVWTDVIAESCPGQARAFTIEIIPRLEEG